MRYALVTLVVAAVAEGVPAAQRDRQPPGIDELLTTYSTGDVQVIDRTVSTLEQFEKLRRALGYEAGGRFYGQLAEWDRARRASQAVFMLDLARVGLNHQWPYWLDVLEEARKFVTGRQALPGQIPRDDAFEIAWHKTAVAMLMGLRSPDLVDKHGLKPLSGRLVADPPASAEPRLVDPWITLARAMVEEQRAILEPEARSESASEAVRLYDEAARSDATRAEARVRKSRMLLAIERPADALTSLEGTDELTSDVMLRYWSRLFKGRALEALGRLDAAVDAYESGRGLVAGAQAPMVALMALALRREEPEQAARLAEEIRTEHTNANDPWWVYPLGDFRFFQARLAALRLGMLR